MSGQSGRELEEIWRTETPRADPGRRAGVAAAARRATLRMALVAAGEVALTAALAWLSAALVWRGVTAFEALWLVAVWSGWAVSVRFVVHNRRGVWSAQGESIRDYLVLRRERAVRKLRMVRFTLRLLMFQVAIVGALYGWGRLRGRAGLGNALDVALLAAVTAGYLAWAFWYRRRAADELERARSQLAQFDADGAAADDV